MLPCLTFLLFLLPYTTPTPSSRDIWSRLHPHWDEWIEMWPGVGYCRYGQSLIADINSEVCTRKRCLLSWNASSLIDLDKLIGEEDVVHHDHLHHCYLPTGGQSRHTGKGSPQVSFVVTVYADDMTSAMSLLELYRTASEVLSGEFVLVFDVGSSNMPVTLRLIEYLQRMFNADITVIDHVEPKGYLMSANEGMRVARGKYALLLSSDVIVLPGWIALMMKTILSHPSKVGMVGPLILNPEGKVREAGGFFLQGGKLQRMGIGEVPKRLPVRHASVVDYLSPACVLVDRDLFLHLGLFDTQFNPAFYEDLDAALTYRSFGYTLVLQSLAVVVRTDSSYYGPSETQRNHIMPLHKELFEKKHASVLGSFCPERPPTCPQPVSPSENHAFSSFIRQPNRVLILDIVPPEPDKDAGSIRLSEMIGILQGAGFSITFEPFSTGRHPRYVLKMISEGVSYLYPKIVQGVSKYAQKYGPRQPLEVCPWKLIIASRRDIFWANARHLKRLCPRTPIIFDTVDVHFLREIRKFDQERNALLTTLQTSERHAALSRLMQMESKLITMTDREINLMKIANITYVVSASEYELIRQKAPEVDVRIVSNMYRPPVKFLYSDPVMRNGAIFVGSMCHPPNVGAVEFIVDEILSNKTFPFGFKMHIVVSRSAECPDTIIEKAAAHRLVELHRDISNEALADLHERVKVCLAPVKYGAGVKGKVNYALLHGVPVISTVVGAEGMYLVDGDSVMIADSGHEFYTSLIKLYSDVELWQKLRAGGLKVMQEHFSVDVARQTILQSLKDLNIEMDSKSWICPYRSQCPSLLKHGGLTVFHSNKPDKLYVGEPPKEKIEFFKLEYMYPWIVNRTAINAKKQKKSISRALRGNGM